MFGFGKKKAEPQRPERARRSGESRERKSQNLAQLGFLTGVGDDGDIDNLMGNMDVGDDDLEEELAMLLDGKQPRRPKPSPQKSSAGGGSGGRKRSSAGATNMGVDNMDNDDDVDDDDDVDLDDPELEAELGDILGVPSVPAGRAMEVDKESDEETAPPPAPTMSTEELQKLLQERLALYEKAKSVAEAAGDSAKSRRFDRGLKTLKGQLTKAKAGRVVDESEIPPPVSVGVIKKETEPAVPLQDPPSQSLPDSPEKNTQEGLTPNPRPRQIIIDEEPGGENDGQQLQQPLNPTPAFIPRPAPRKTSPVGLPQEITSSPPPLPPRETTQVPVSSVPLDPSVEARLKEYKIAAVVMKRQGDMQGALNYLKLSKALENAAKSGEPVNLDDYPTTEISSQSDPGPPQASPSVAAPEEPHPSTVPAENQSSEGQATGPGEDIFGAPPPPKSVMEALEQRLSKYKSEVEKANAAANSSKARRMGRIVKQYEDAITSYKKGKPVAFDELPTPPGFAPIPTAAPPPAQPKPTAIAVEPRSPSQPADPLAPSGISPVKKPKEDSPGAAPVAGSSRQSPAGVARTSGKQTTKLTLQEKQLRTILQRQKQFKEAALNAKTRGDINQAREFLRTAKGFDKLIQVAQAGLPVDMATLPAAPDAVARLELEEESNFEMVNALDCIMPSGSAGEIYSKLEEDLKQQLKMCMRTRDHFKSIGDVGSANRFESMALEAKRDLDTLRLAIKKNGALPKYHYETRIFSITECNTDIREDEIEITIIQGINYKVSNPDDVDTYIKIELPYPSAEEVQVSKTHIVKDTNNPNYNASYKMSINRTARNFQRFVHRHGFKCEVWSKGGFLRGSTLIGTASVKLLPLETKCTLHDAFDILDGRKSVGKLEVKVRIREPVVAKQITQKKEKWLSIDRT